MSRLLLCHACCYSLSLCCSQCDSLTALCDTLGYVRCQDLKKSFDSPDQLVMVIRAPPETQMQVSEPSKVRASICNELSFFYCSHFMVFLTQHVFGLQGYQVSLKSTRGPIDVFLCPEDSSGVCSPVTGSSPAKASPEPAPAPAQTPPQVPDQPQSRMSAAALEVGVSSPASTTSTATAASQQEPSSQALSADTGEQTGFYLDVVN